MPAAVVRGILLTVGIIAALGIAAYENPEIQQWLDEQRRKLAQFLRNIGDELDPQTRREAEAFAFGASPAPPQHGSTRAEATANTTGAETANASTVRRLPLQGSISADEREERQRLGQQYLARREQQMQEMQERRQSRESVSRSTSFDSIVDEEGKLKVEEVKEEPVAQVEASSSSNPFTDAHEIDRSSTPRPAVPPKIKLEHIDPMPVPESIRSVEDEPMLEMPGPMPGSLPGSVPNTTSGIVPTTEHGELSYEEQLAIALSLSKEEGERATQMTRSGVYEQDLHQAIRLSLQDHQMDAVSSIPDPDTSIPPGLADSVDELYDVTPNLTRASLAQLNIQHPSLQPQIIVPIHELITDTSGIRTPGQRSLSPHAHSSQTMSEAEMIEVEDQASDIISEDGIVTPDSWTEVGSHYGDSDVEMHPPTTA